MIVLDTTVLVYAVGVDHPLRHPCRRIVEAIGAGQVAATTTIEVIQEFAHVRARRRDRRDAASTAADFVQLLTPLLRPDEDDLRRGFDVFVDSDRLGVFGAVLAATVLRSDRLTALVSADRSFAAVSGLDQHDPADPGMLGSLGVADP